MRSFLRVSLQLILVFGLILYDIKGAFVFGLPQGENIVSGQAQFNLLDANTLQVTASDGTIIEYDSFNIDLHQWVDFQQPSSSSVVLNRVIGVDPSQILGQLTGNGQIYLTNPNGIFFGENAQIDTGSFLASTLQISNDDFLSGNYELTQSFKDPSFIINHGNIHADPNGFVVLASPLVSNEGVIVADVGQVLFNGANQTTISFDPQGLIQYAIEDVEVSGPVIIPEIYVSEVLDQIITESGLEAGAVVEDHGNIRLVSSEGFVHHSGEIQADRLNGDYQGRVLIDSQELTIVSEGANISVDGNNDNSSGGLIKVLSNMEKGLTVVESQVHLNARAGDSAGDGGFIEVSGKHFLFRGSVDASSKHGKMGTFLLDPLNIQILNGVGGLLDPLLPNVTFLGDLLGLDTLSESVLEAQNSNIILQAQQDITLSDLSDNQLSLASLDAEKLVLQAGRHIIFEDSNDTIQTAGGDIHLEADSLHSTLGAADGVGSLNLGHIISNGGDITLIASDFILNAAIDAGSGDVYLSPYALASSFNLGTVGGAVLTDSELDQISTTGNLVFGQVQTAGLDGFGSESSLIKSANILADGLTQDNKNLVFITDGDINNTQEILTAKNIVTEGNIELRAEGTIGSSDQPVTTEITGDGALIVEAGSENNGVSVYLQGNVSADDVRVIGDPPGLILYNNGIFSAEVSQNIEADLRVIDLPFEKVNDFEFDIETDEDIPLILVEDKEFIRHLDSANVVQILSYLIKKNRPDVDVNIDLSEAAADVFVQIPQEKNVKARIDLSETFQGDTGATLAMQYKDISVLNEQDRKDESEILSLTTNALGPETEFEVGLGRLSQEIPIGSPRVRRTVAEVENRASRVFDQLVKLDVLEPEATVRPLQGEVDASVPFLNEEKTNLKIDVFNLGKEETGVVFDDQMKSPIIDLSSNVLGQDIDLEIGLGQELIGDIDVGLDDGVDVGIEVGLDDDESDPVLDDVLEGQDDQVPETEKEDSAQEKSSSSENTVLGDGSLSLPLPGSPNMLKLNYGEDAASSGLNGNSLEPANLSNSRTREDEFDVGIDDGLEQGADIGSDVGIDDGLEDNFQNQRVKEQTRKRMSRNFQSPSNLRPRNDEVVYDVISQTELSLVGPDGDNMNLKIVRMLDEKDIQPEDDSFTVGVSAQGVRIDQSDDQPFVMLMKLEDQNQKIEKETSSNGQKIAFNLSGSSNTIDYNGECLNVNPDVAESLLKENTNYFSDQSKSLKDTECFLCQTLPSRSKQSKDPVVYLKDQPLNLALPGSNTVAAIQYAGEVPEDSVFPKSSFRSPENIRPIKEKIVYDVVGSSILNLVGLRGDEIEIQVNELSENGKKSEASSIQLYVSHQGVEIKDESGDPFILKVRSKNLEQQKITDENLKSFSGPFELISVRERLQVEFDISEEKHSISFAGTCSPLKQSVQTALFNYDLGPAGNQIQSQVNQKSFICRRDQWKSVRN